MSLTDDEIAAGATYTGRCKGMNFAGQVANLKAIHGQSTAGYDPQSRTWTVTLGPAATTNALRLKGAIRLGAEAVRQGEPIGPSGEPRPERESVTRAERWERDHELFAAYGDLSDWEGAPAGGI